MRYLRSILDDLKKGENLDLYITLIAATIVVILNLLGVADQALVSSLSLAVLALLVASMLGVRHRLDDLQRQSLLLNKNQTIVDRRRQLEVSFDKRFADAQSLDLYGVSLLGLVGSYKWFLEAKAASGCKIRVLLLDPESSVPELMAGLTEARALLRSDILRTTETFAGMRTMGNVELRYTEVPVPFGLVVSNLRGQAARVEVSFYAYHVPVSDRPGLVLSREVDPHWYDFFAQQFDKIWADARKYET